MIQIKHRQQGEEGGSRCTDKVLWPLGKKGLNVGIWSLKEVSVLEKPGRDRETQAGETPGQVRDQVGETPGKGEIHPGETETVGRGLGGCPAGRAQAGRAVCVTTQQAL